MNEKHKKSVYEIVCIYDIEKQLGSLNWLGMEMNYLLPEMSISLIATAMEGSINKVVMALMSKEAEAELMPMLERRTPTPACSSIWGVQQRTPLMPENCKQAASRITQSVPAQDYEGKMDTYLQLRCQFSFSFFNFFFPKHEWTFGYDNQMIVEVKNLYNCIQGHYVPRESCELFLKDT